MQPISISQIQYYLTNLQQLTLQKGKIQPEKCALLSQIFAILAKNIGKLAKCRTLEIMVQSLPVISRIDAFGSCWNDTSYIG